MIVFTINRKYNWWRNNTWRESVWEERLSNKVTLLREMCFYTKVLSFLRVFRFVERNIVWYELQYCNHFCDNEIFFKTVLSTRQEMSNHVNSCICYYFSHGVIFIVSSWSFVDVNNFIWGRIDYPTPKERRFKGFLCDFYLF